MAVAVYIVGQLRMAGLPDPVEEYRFAPPRRWRFDLAWPERMLAVEVEGGVWVGGRHTRPAGYEKDCEKYSEAAVLGWRVIRVTTQMVKDGRALALIERALTQEVKGC
jgi:very-short-patch-repair endonuclease